MFKSLCTFLLLLSLTWSNAVGQGNAFCRAGFMKGNRVHTVFGNWGVIGQPAPAGSRGSWIYETNGYIGDVSFMLGLELPVRDYNNDGKLDTVHSVITCPVGRPTKMTDTDPVTGKYWTFEPVDGYLNPIQSSPALLSNPETWPTSWPGHPELNGRWYGLFGSNSAAVSEETYFRVDDSNDERFNLPSNNKWGVALIPDSTRPTLKGHGIHIDVRYLQSNLPEYRDVLFRVFDITNEGTTNYARAVFGTLMGNYIGVTSTEDYREYANDAAVYFASGDFILNQNVPDNFVGNPLWNGPMGKFAEAFAELPTGTRIASVDAFVPSNNLDLADDESLWNSLLPGQYLHPASIINDTVVAAGEDMDYFYGSNYFGLNAGETKRVVSVLAYGYSKSEIQQKVLMAKALWSSHFQPDSVKAAITLTAPTSHQKLSGNTTIAWNASRPGGSVSIWYSPDAGETWSVITPGAANSGNYIWNTALVPNATFGMLRVFACDSAGTPYGFAESQSYFTVNNGGTSIPFIHILNEELESGPVVDSDSLTLRYFAGSSGGDSLSVSLSYRTGAHEPFQQFDSYRIATDTLPQTRNVVLRLLPNAYWFQIRAVVTVGAGSAGDSTSSFTKWTAREVIPTGNITYKGPSFVLPRIDIVDRSQLRSHLYTITFTDTASSGDKTFSVYDQTSGSYTVQNVPFKPAIESSPFDGMALFALDVKTELDRTRSGWNRLTDQRTLWTQPINLDGFPELGYPNPSDYQIIFYDTVVDTSVEISGDGWSVPATPVKVKVTEIGSGRHVKAAFVDQGNGLELVFHEEIMGITRWTWDVSLSWTSAQAAAVAGDTVTLFVTKGLSFKDTLQVMGITDAVASRQPLPGMFKLEQNYPNPFNPTTTIQFALPHRSHVTLTVYNTLGQQVATLVNGEIEAGYHSVQFSAKGRGGSSLASGVYFYRLQAESFVNTKKLLLVK